MFSREPAPPGKDRAALGRPFLSCVQSVSHPVSPALPELQPPAPAWPLTVPPPHPAPSGVTTGHSDDRGQCPPWRLCVFLTHMVMGEGNSSYLRGHAVLSPFTRPAAPGWRARASAGPLCCPEASGQQPGAGEGVTPT